MKFCIAATVFNSVRNLSRKSKNNFSLRKMTVPNMKVNKLWEKGYNNCPTLCNQFVEPLNELIIQLWHQIAKRINSADKRTASLFFKIYLQKKGGGGCLNYGFSLSKLLFFFFLSLLQQQLQWAFNWVKMIQSMLVPQRPTYPEPLPSPVQIDPGQPRSKSVRKALQKIPGI